MGNQGFMIGYGHVVNHGQHTQSGLERIVVELGNFPAEKPQMTNIIGLGPFVAL